MYELFNWHDITILLIIKSKRIVIDLIMFFQIVFRCFLVRSSNYRSSQDPTLDTFALSMMYQDNIMSYRILQVIIPTLFIFHGNYLVMNYIILWLHNFMKSFFNNCRNGYSHELCLRWITEKQDLPAFHH